MLVGLVEQQRTLTITVVGVVERGAAPMQQVMLGMQTQEQREGRAERVEMVEMVEKVETILPLALPVWLPVVVVVGQAEQTTQAEPELPVM
jgi:hypothetical protein